MEHKHRTHTNTRWSRVRREMAEVMHPWSLVEVVLWSGVAPVVQAYLSNVLGQMTTWIYWNAMLTEPESDTAVSHTTFKLRVIKLIAVWMCVWVEHSASLGMCYTNTSPLTHMSRHSQHYKLPLESHQHKTFVGEKFMQLLIEINALRLFTEKRKRLIKMSPWQMCAVIKATGSQIKYQFVWLLTGHCTSSRRKYWGQMSGVLYPYSLTSKQK